MDVVDRISNLPPEITDHILQGLPLRDAIGTGILSTHWRFKWALLPQLILDHSFFWSIQKFSIYKSANVDDRMLEYSNIVNNILLSHDGSISKFVLDIPNWFTEDADIVYWIHFVSRKVIKELTLSSMNNETGIELPSLIFSCVGFNHLTHLTLVNWHLPSISMTFRGFPCLISLKFHLNDYAIGQANKLGIMVSKCSLLETLNVDFFDDESCLTIHAPKLQSLVVGDCLSSILLKETHKKRFWNRYADEPGLPHEKLKINIPSDLRELKYLVLNGVRLNSQWDYLIRFLNMAPKLQILEIEVDSGPVASSITVLGDCCLHHLKILKLRFIGDVPIDGSSDGSVFQLMKMILSSSPVLEVMTVSSGISHSDEVNMAKEVWRYPRASTNAEIIFTGLKEWDKFWLEHAFCSF